MELNRLSSNLISIIDELLRNQELVNLVANIGNNPLQTNVNPNSIAPRAKNERVIPYPFDVEFKSDVRSQVHIYYPFVTMDNNANVGKVGLVFDIVVHKDIWLYSENGKKLVRPYEIISQIFKTFNKRDIPNLGKIHFLDMVHIVVNENFEGIRLTARFTEF